MNIAQKAAYALLMVSTAAEEILDTLDNMGHKLSPLENDASDFTGKIAHHFAERVGLTPAQIESALTGGENIAERAMLPDDVTPPSHQLTGKPDPTLN